MQPIIIRLFLSLLLFSSALLSFGQCTVTISPSTAVICNDNQSVQLTSNITGGGGGGGGGYN